MNGIMGWVTQEKAPGTWVVFRPHGGVMSWTHRRMVCPDPMMNLNQFDGLALVQIIHLDGILTRDLL